MVFGVPCGIARLDLAASQRGPLEGTSMEQLRRRTLALSRYRRARTFTDSHSETVGAVAFAPGGATPPTW
jgi:hypothetical protein